MPDPLGGVRVARGAALLAAGLMVLPAAAQETREAMAAECTGANAVLALLCLESVLALEAARGTVGLAAAQGTPVPGSTSTLGRRLGTSPRLALSLRGALTRASMPDPRSGEAPARERSFWVPAVEGGFTLGVLDGFSVLPTVGGILSLDLLGSVGVAPLSEDEGFDGSTQWFGYGARLGLLRESFTLPGVSVSAQRHHLTDIQRGTPADRARAVFDPTVTSLRATVGKDFLAFGILGGWGWERYGGRSAVAVERSSGVLPIETVTGSAESDDFESDRVLFFGGISYTFLVLQLAAEGGFATGWDDVPGRSTAGYDPTGGTIFGSVSGRLTF